MAEKGLWNSKNIPATILTKDILPSQQVINHCGVQPHPGMKKKAEKTITRKALFYKAIGVSLILIGVTTFIGNVVLTIVVFNIQGTSIQEHGLLYEHPFNATEAPWIFLLPPALALSILIVYAGYMLYDEGKHPCTCKRTHFHICRRVYSRGESGWPSHHTERGIIMINNPKKQMRPSSVCNEELGEGYERSYCPSCGEED